MATSPPVSGDAVRVRDGQCARPVRADPYCFFSVRLGTDDGTVMNFGDGVSRTVPFLKLTHCFMPLVVRILLVATSQII